jgi:hypothetical protein
MIHHVGENELFHQTEHGEILMPPDLIQSPLFLRRKKRKLLHLGQRLGHERFGEVELLVTANDIVYFPADPLGGFERRLV